MGLLALTIGSEETWRSDEDVAVDDPVLRSGAGAKASVDDRGAMASAKAATTIFIVDNYV